MAPYSISLHARKNGRRIARDAAPGNGEFDIHSLAAWAQANLTSEEIERVIAMLQSHLDKPAEDDELPDPTAVKRERTGLDSRHAPSREYLERFPNAGRLKG
jgi:hypothetical protein